MIRYILDLETTGPDPWHDEPCEVALLRVPRLGAEPEVVIHERCRPSIPIGPGATDVHGIADADVADARPWSEVAADVAAAVDGHETVAYNAAFDGLILHRAMTGARPYWLCPLTWMRTATWGRYSTPACPLPVDVETGRKRQRLGDVAAWAGVEPGGDLHSALTDARLTWAIVPAVVRLWRRLRPDVPLFDADRMRDLPAMTTRLGLEHERAFARMDRQRGQEPRPSAWEKIGTVGDCG